MSSQRASLQFPKPGPATRSMLIAILVVSVGAKLLDATGLGISRWLPLVYDTIPQGQLWRLFTYAFYEGSAIGLLFQLFILYLFSTSFETRWGQRDFLRFCAFTVVFAGALAVPLHYVLNAILPFNDIAIVTGPRAIIDALLVSMAVITPHSTIAFGFVLPIKVRTAVFAFLGLEMLFGIMDGGAGLSLTVAGMLMGYLLTTGNWRPSRWWANFKIWRLRRIRADEVSNIVKNHGRSRGGLYVVRDKDDDPSRTLH